MFPSAEIMLGTYDAWHTLDDAQAPGHYAFGVYSAFVFFLFGGDTPLAIAREIAYA